MLDEVAIAISTGAAGNIVAYMLNGQMDALRAKVARMFRHGTEQDRSVVLRALEDDAVALTQKKVSEADLARQWSNSLLSYLTVHSEARGDIESFASSPVASKTTNIGSMNHHGHGHQIAGNNYGDATFNG